MNAHFPEKHMRISACTIAKNEAENIARSIESYRDFVDEIIVVDTGSTDDTVQIAEAHGATVLHFTWCDDFSAAKNFALDHATGDWIIFLDADEYFNSGAGKKVREAISVAIADNRNAIGCRMRNIDAETGQLKTEGFQIRVFRAGGRYELPIHEHLVQPNRMRILTVDPTWFYLYHTGYSVNLIKEKSARNLEMLQKQEKSAASPNLKASIHLYLSDCYINLGDLSRAKEEAETYLNEKKRCGFVMLGLDNKPYLNIIKCLENENASLADIDQWVHRFETAFPNTADSLYARAKILFRQRRFCSAVCKFEQSWKLAENSSSYELNDVLPNQYDLTIKSAQCYEALGETSKSIEEYTAAWRLSTDTRAALLLIYLLNHLPSFDIPGFFQRLAKGANDTLANYLLEAVTLHYFSQSILELYLKKREHEPDCPIPLFMLAFVQAGKGDFSGAASLFYKQVKATHNTADAMRALLCARLSGDGQLVSIITPSALPCHRAALGDETALIDPDTDMPELVNLLGEVQRLSGDEAAAALAETTAQKLGAAHAQAFAEALELQNIFSAALAVIRLAPETPQNLFLHAYYLLRTNQPGLAEDVFTLAQAQGCDDEALPELLENAGERLKKARAGRQTDAAAELARITTAFGGGDFEQIWDELCALRTLAEPDADWYSAAAVALYYLERYGQASLAARAGLLRFPQSADLHFNLGDILARLGKTDDAKGEYALALANSGNEQTRQQIQTALAAVSAAE